MGVSNLPRGLHALVVDDEASVRQALKLAMEFAGWSVREASSAREALELIDSQMPDLIACDKNMPGDSGIDLLRKVRERTDRVSFHLITGFGNAESAEAGMELDIDSYTEKPFKDIFAVIHHIGTAHVRRQSKSAQRDVRARSLVDEGVSICRALVIVSDPEARKLAAELLREVWEGSIVVVDTPLTKHEQEDWDIIITDLQQADASLESYHAPLAVVWSTKPIRPHEMIGFADKGATAVVTRYEREALAASLKKQKARMQRAVRSREEQGIPSSLPRPATGGNAPSVPGSTAAQARQIPKPPPLPKAVARLKMPPPPSAAAKNAFTSSLQPPTARATTSLDAIPRQRLTDEPLSSAEPETLQALVVDDEPAIRKALRSAMELRGWSVREAPSGDAGLEAVREQMPDLIVCDKNMPGRSGVDLLQDVRWLTEDVSFHLLTAFANEKSAQASMVLGADSYLQKPFDDVFKLLDTIERAHHTRSKRNDFRRERGQFGPSLRSLPPKQHESALVTAVIIKDDMMRSLAAAAVAEMAPVGTQLEQWESLPQGDRVADLVVCDPDVVDEVTSRYSGAEVLVWSDKTVPRELRFALANRGVRAVVAGADHETFRDELGTIFARALTPSDTRPAVSSRPEDKAVAAHPASPKPSATSRSDTSRVKPAVSSSSAPTIEIDEITQHELHRATEGLDAKNYYEVLGVPTNATKAEIRSAYFVISKKFHPDVFFGKELGQYKKMMEQVFRAATDAYETLSRRKRRQKYDADNKIVAEPRTSSQPVPPPLTRSIPSAPKSMPAQRNVTSPPRDRPGSGGRYRVPSRGGQRVRVVSEDGTTSRVEGLVDQARMEEKQGNIPAAIRTVRRAISRQPSVQELQTELDRLVRLGQNSAATTARDEASKLSQSGNWIEAAEAWSAVCERDPTDDEAHAQVARAMVEANRNLVDAKRYAETAIRLNEENVEAKVVLAKIYLQAGMRVQAKKQLRAVLERNADHVSAAQLLREIEA